MSCVTYIKSCINKADARDTSCGYEGVNAKLFWMIDGIQVSLDCLSGCCGDPICGIQYSKKYCETIFEKCEHVREEINKDTEKFHNDVLSMAYDLLDRFTNERDQIYNRVNGIDENLTRDDNSIKVEINTDFSRNNEEPDMHIYVIEADID